MLSVYIHSNIYLTISRKIVHIIRRNATNPHSALNCLVTMDIRYMFIFFQVNRSDFFQFAVIFVVEYIVILGCIAATFENVRGININIVDFQ